MSRMSKSIFYFTILVAFLAFPLILGRTADPPASSGPAKVDLPVRMVALFTSGVGYFEHGGTVQGNSSVELRFRSAQINDILKSLVLEDLDGGKIGAIAYPSPEPLEKTLQNFQVNIASNPSMPELLNQMRGAMVLVTIHAEQIEGVILDLEKRRKVLSEQGNQVLDTWLFDILSGATMRSVWLDEVQKIELRDPELQMELQKALSALAEARNQEKKPVLINFLGNGNRRVRLRYVIEAPVWKTSYRLILPQNKGGKSKLQGWALVENQTDVDWDDVQLSLVRGRPISFVEDLFKPIYISRPVIEPELYKGLRPQSYESGISKPAPAAAPRAAMKKAAGGGRGGGSGRGAAKGRAALEEELEEETAQPVETPFDATAGIVSAASAGQEGELFQYTVGKISLPRLRSAMLPILTEEVAAERVSIFNVQVMPRNPVRGVILQNSTDKYIMQGPVTVFDGSTYAGDANVVNLPPGQSRLLSYALDLEVQVDSTKNSQASAVQTAKILEGVLELSRKDTFSREYVIQNNSDAERNMIIEHRFRSGWKLAGGGQPFETTGTHYRFKLTVPKGKTESMTVVEEKLIAESLTIMAAEVSSLESYSRSSQIPKSVRESLAKAIGFMRAVMDTEGRLAEKRKALEDIQNEQGRIRSNMGAVNNTSQYYARLLEKLNTQETEIEGIQSEVRELTRKLDARKHELDSYLAGLSIE